MYVFLCVAFLLDTDVINGCMKQKNKQQLYNMGVSSLKMECVVASSSKATPFLFEANSQLKLCWSPESIEDDEVINEGEACYCCPSFKEYSSSSSSSPSSHWDNRFAEMQAGGYSYWKSEKKASLWKCLNSRYINNLYKKDCKGRRYILLNTRVRDNYRFLGYETIVLLDSLKFDYGEFQRDVEVLELGRRRQLGFVLSQPKPSIRFFLQQIAEVERNFTNIEQRGSSVFRSLMDILKAIGKFLTHTEDQPLKAVSFCFCVPSFDVSAGFVLCKSSLEIPSLARFAVQTMFKQYTHVYVAIKCVYTMENEGEERVGCAYPSLSGVYTPNTCDDYARRRIQQQQRSRQSSSFDRITLSGKFEVSTLANGSVRTPRTKAFTKVDFPGYIDDTSAILGPKSRNVENLMKYTAKDTPKAPNGLLHQCISLGYDEEEEGKTEGFNPNSLENQKVYTFSPLSVTASYRKGNVSSNTHRLRTPKGTASSMRKRVSKEAKVLNEAIQLMVGGILINFPSKSTKLVDSAPE